MRLQRSSIAYSAFLLSAIVAVSALASSPTDDICPQDPKNKHKIGSYDFGYQSWSWPSQTQTKHIFCNCVRNFHSTFSIFIDWKDTGITSFVPPSDSVLSYEEHDDNQHFKKQVDLYFGARPESIKVNTIFHGSKQRSKLELKDWPTNSVQNQVIKISNYANENSIDGSIITRGRAFLPSQEALRKHKNSTFQQLAEHIEKNPDLLVPLDFEFISTPVFENNKIVQIKQTCKYSFGGERIQKGKNGKPNYDRKVLKELRRSGDRRLEQIAGKIENSISQRSPRWGRQGSSHWDRHSTSTELDDSDIDYLLEHRLPAAREIGRLHLSSSTGSNIVLEIEDKELNQTIFQQSQVTLSSWQGKPFNIEGTTHLGRNNSSVIQKRQTRILFKTSDGRTVLAALPITFKSP